MCVNLWFKCIVLPKLSVFLPVIILSLLTLLVATDPGDQTPSS
jgi:hypothetical protein